MTQLKVHVNQTDHDFSPTKKPKVTSTGLFHINVWVNEQTFARQVLLYRTGLHTRFHQKQREFYLHKYN